MAKLTSVPKVTSRANKTKKGSQDGTAPQGSLMRDKKQVKHRKFKLMRGK